MTTESILQINESLFVCRGTHKTVYTHPKDASLIIKIPHSKNDIDLKRELRYRQLLKQRKEYKSMIPKYYGTIKTSAGEAYVFECLRDYDGSLSKDFEAFIKNNILPNHDLYYLKKVMIELKNLYFSEKIVTSDIDPGNMVFQMLSPDLFTIKIVDNIGSPVLIPLEYYFDYFLTKKMERYYKRFLNNLTRKFPELFTSDFIKQIE